MSTDAKKAPTEALSLKVDPRDYNLLVVDDTESNRDMLARRLARRGFGVFVAESGERALSILAEKPVDLMLLDIVMPGTDGLDVLERVRRTSSQTELPIIMATAKAESEDVVRAFELGANDYVTKPLDFQIVLARIQSQLKGLTQVPALAVGEPTPAEVGSGAVLARKYRLNDEIGNGSFGVVFRGRNLELDQPIAIKILRPPTGEDHPRPIQLRREGIAACRVEHPNAVGVFDFGVTATGVAYLVMELLDGQSLEHLLRSCGRLDASRAVELIVPVCQALAGAHSAGILHRDVKPANIFLSLDEGIERVKVLDFGLAKLAGASAARSTLTNAGWVVGTPAYMAPERISGEPGDDRADVYSLGITLFELLTGELPFAVDRASPMAVAMAHVESEPRSLSEVLPGLPVELESLVAEAMSRDPAQRPSAASLSRRLAQIDLEVTGRSPSDGICDHLDIAPTVVLDTPLVLPQAGRLATPPWAGEEDQAASEWHSLVDGLDRAKPDIEPSR